ncbi:hypothetical protein L3X38_016891 [Prunus dulcis]|uniref:Uncharacterized protein n=1 Tax=Prunus dulcis TaxID=3755 RepID=A0AAD4W647_PRUDU|nr:hypothetical protein L3X38_016891 [Prunus dulcis]
MKKEHDLLERRGDVVAVIVSSSQKEERSCCRRNQTRRERNEKPNPKLEMSLTEIASSIDLVAKLILMNVIKEKDNTIELNDRMDSKL